MRIAAVQHDIVWEDVAATCALVEPMIAEAVAGGARLVVLTEMFSTGFSMAPERVAEPVDGPSRRFLDRTARDHGVTVVASVPTRPSEDAMPVNRLWIVGPSGPVGHYDKVHPFSFSGEDAHYSPGRGSVVTELDGLRLCPTVCYDLRFAYHYWDRAAETDAYVVVANWPAARREHWRALLRARAIENQAYVVGVNRVGTGDGLVYAGDSVILDPLGSVLAEAGDAPAVLSADIDTAEVTRVREAFPFLPDRRH